MFYLDQLRIRKLKVFSLPPYIFSSLVFFSLCRFEFLTHVTFLCLENLEHFLQDKSVYLAPGAYVSSKSWISAVTLNSPSSSNFGVAFCPVNSILWPVQGRSLIHSVFNIFVLVRTGVINSKLITCWN